MTGITPVSTVADFAVLSSIPLPLGPVTFQQWIEKLIAERFHTSTALATAMGLQLTPFMRGAAAGTFNVVNLLKLAKVVDEHPSVVLRMAGKGDVADLIESLYGPTDVKPHEREHLVKWRALDDQARRAIETLMRELPQDDAEQKPAKRKKTA
jgi:hypothetical protein